MNNSVPRHKPKTSQHSSPYDFNDPELNLRAEYSLFDRQTGRLIRSGNGESCQRIGQNGIERHPCPSPDLCPLAQGGLWALWTTLCEPR